MNRIRIVVALSATCSMFTVLIVMAKVVSAPALLSAQVAFMTGCAVYTGLSALVLAIREFRK